MSWMRYQNEPLDPFYLLEKAQLQSTRAGRADPTGTCMTETRPKDKFSKDKETVTEKQSDHKYAHKPGSSSKAIST